jgi:hypothetical protein
LAGAPGAMGVAVAGAFVGGKPVVDVVKAVAKKFTSHLAIIIQRVWDLRLEREDSNIDMRS